LNRSSATSKTSTTSKKTATSPLPSGDFLIKALTPIENFNEFFDSEFSDDEFDTVGGLVMSAFGHLPKRNEITEIGAYRFRILNADSRRIHLLRLTPIAR
jgi:magnesium and cobalt transporter